MKYFIPEWDDRVDPDYDFLNDGITADRDPYVHDVYSHEIYPSPNYDGILVSKSVIEDNKTKTDSEASDSSLIMQSVKMLASPRQC